MARYINADALVKRIDKELCKPCRDGKQDYSGVRCRACWVDDMLIWIDSEPEVTADVREVHSHWMDRHIPFTDGETEYICLNCLKTNGKANPPICPNCGAIMDEGDE